MYKKRIFCIRFFLLTYTVLNASGIAISENLMKSVAELPADDLTAVELEFDGVVPERQRALLEASAQDDVSHVLLLHGRLHVVYGFG